LISFVGEEVEVSLERYAVVKVRNLPNVNYIAIVKGKEFEIVIPEKELVKLEKVSEVDTGYRLLKLDVNVPLDVVGYISKVSSAMANAKIPILILSLFSDVILVKEDFIDKALNVLKDLGFSVRR